MSNKSRLKRIFLLFPVILGSIFLIAYRRTDFARVSEGDQEIYDVFIVSAYYYPISHSLGTNAIAVILSTDFRFLTDVRAITFLAKNGSSTRKITTAVEEIAPHKVCSWVPLFATAEGISDLTSLSIFIGNDYQEISFKSPVYDKHEVITCISPLFSSDQWQLITLALHTYKRFGSYVHLYVRSMVEKVFNLVREYEKEGRLTIESWPRLRLTSISEDDFNPNLNVEFRNQAAAQTDCLLKYKEAAEFISFMDLDDIIFPRIAGTYSDEFREFFLMNKLDLVYDEAGNEVDPSSGIGYLYYVKHNIHTRIETDPGKFSLTKLISSIKFMQHDETGKVVVRPRYVNHTWIHWPLKVTDGQQRYTVPIGTNVIAHFKSLDPVDKDFYINKSQKPPFFNPTDFVLDTVSPLVSRFAIKAMEEDWHRMASQPSYRSIWHRLPSTNFYFAYIKECFDKVFYKLFYGGQLQKIKCPGPERCPVPLNTGIQCVNSKADYFSSTGGTLLNIHYGQQSGFIIENDCIF